MNMGDFMPLLTYLMSMIAPKVTRVGLKSCFGGKFRNFGALHISEILNPYDVLIISVEEFLNYLKRLIF